MSFDNPCNLNSTELEIAKCIVAGMNATKCATSLHLSKRTVDHYLRCIYRKLAIDSDPLICKQVVAVNLLRDLYGYR